MLEPSLYCQFASSIFGHAGNKSEHTRRPSYTSCPNKGSILILSLSGGRHGIDYPHLSRDIQMFLLKNQSSYQSFSEVAALFRYSDAVDSYSEFSSTSPHTRLLVFPRFDMLQCSIHLLIILVFSHHMYLIVYHNWDIPNVN